MKKIVGLSAAIVALACGGSAQIHDEASLPARESMSDKEAIAACDRTCNPRVEAPVEVAYRDASGGASVIYTTTGDADALRSCVSEVARAHGAVEPVLANDLYAIPHSARVQDVEDGIMMTLIASAQNDDTALRRDVQQDVWGMQRSCVASDYLF
jgi:hypothetical protein